MRPQNLVLKLMQTLIFVLKTLRILSKFLKNIYLGFSYSFFGSWRVIEREHTDDINDI